MTEGCGSGAEVGKNGVRFVQEWGGVLVEGVTQFKYLGISILDQTYGDCLVVRWNIKRERKVWG